MDVDEVDDLAHSLGRITTADADSLIFQFKQILSESYGQLSNETCAFFLDMNNWNLPAALGCFYDYDAQDMLSVPQMTFVNDVTMGEDESVPPNTPFLKTWRLLNSGKERWPEGCTLKRVQGNDVICQSSYIPVQSALPGQLIHASVHMISPSNPGVYQSLWRLTLSSEVPFGDQIWCIITVEEHSVLDVTQKLADTRCFENKSSTENRTTTLGSNIAAFATPHWDRTTNTNSQEAKKENAYMFNSIGPSESAAFKSLASTPSQRLDFTPHSHESTETNLEATFRSGGTNDSTEFTSASVEASSSKSHADANTECASRTFLSKSGTVEYFENHRSF